jgi:hypothetical protein
MIKLPFVAGEPDRPMRRGHLLMATSIGDAMPWACSST